MSGKIVYVSSSLCPHVTNQKSYLTSDVVSADDSIVWAAFCSYSASQVHQQQDQDGSICQLYRGKLLIELCCWSIITEEICC